VIGKETDIFNLHCRFVCDELFPVFSDGSLTGAVTMRKFFAPLLVRM
jgi:hypothetical protein